MTSDPHEASPRLVASLARLARSYPVARKLIVAPTMGAGRELLRRLALDGEGWVGIEVTTPRPLALRIARGAMERGALRAIDAFDFQALADEAIDVALRSDGSGLGEVAEGVGFREHVHGAIRALRSVGVDARALESARLPDMSKRLFLLGVLRRYERLLDERRLADEGAIFRLALSALDEEGARMPRAVGSAVVALVPGLGTRGLTGRLVAALASRGARVLETDPVVGWDPPASMLWNRPGRAGAHAHLLAPEGLPPELEPPDIELFGAASVREELRTVLRRVIQRGLRWDEVEIVAVDAAAYGSALHDLSVRLGIPVTYAVGLPIERTRPGRVVRAYLDWIEEGFQAAPIRRLLEAGDLRPPRSEEYHAPAELARRFRSLRIGWGRRRYRRQIRDALAGVEEMRPHREHPEAFERRKARLRGELGALRSILFPTLKATPAVPDTMGEEGAPVSPAELARGLQAFLRRVPKGRGADRAARDTIARVLERVEGTLRRRTEFRAASTILRRHLALRVRAPSPVDPDEEGLPWGSRGGHLHLSDVEHGGFTGRRAAFIVGADADRLPGPGLQDPVLLDGDRRILHDGLPTSSEVLRERTFRLAALFARLRGTVSVSFCGWDPSEARALGPSPLLLQAFRLARRDRSLTFEDLRTELGRARSALPGEAPCLDGDDVWLAALDGGALLRSGVRAVRASFTGLDRGMAAQEAREGMPGPHQGVVSARPGELDPRVNRELVLSASRLEDLGSCPLRYLQRSVLRIRPPDDPEMDPERWLDPLRRGGLLHDVFEETLRRARGEAVSHEDPAFEQLALDILARGVERLKPEVPVPGEGALRRERAALQEDVRSFVRMVRELGAPWVALELKFGLDDDPPLELRVGDAFVRLRGAIDRVDETLEGVRVIDYKTGVPRGFARTGTFHGGRRLQHGIYTHAAEARLADARVLSGEYHYPTRRGENQVFPFDRLALAGVGGLVAQMLDVVAAGAFVPTESADDCRFCDFAEICRVTTAAYGSVRSPLADWSLEHLNTGLSPAFVALKKIRGYEE